jgi:hypothetical protein
MSSARVLVWMKGKAKQKHSLTLKSKDSITMVENKWFSEKNFFFFFGLG